MPQVDAAQRGGCYVLACRTVRHVPDGLVEPLRQLGVLSPRAPPEPEGRARAGDKQVAVSTEHEVDREVVEMQRVAYRRRGHRIPQADGFVGSAGHDDFATGAICGHAHTTGVCHMSTRPPG